MRSRATRKRSVRVGKSANGILLDFPQRIGDSRGMKFKPRHGRSGTPIYRIWADMRKRCLNPNAFAYDRYGGRGITFCDRWKTFENFLADMGERPSPKHTLERRDNDRDYSPENCLWATRKEQARNRSSSVRITAGGLTLTIAEWAERTGVHQRVVWMRLNRYGWPVEKAVGLK